MLRYAISDRKPIAVSEEDREAGLLEQVRRLADRNVNFLQLREKDLDAKQLIGLTRRVITAARSGFAGRSSLLRVLVNGRPDIALASGADGVHLPSGPDQLTVQHVRTLFGQRSVIVSVSCHTLAEVERASRNGADLVLFGPVFGKLLADGSQLEGVGLASLTQACTIAAKTPVLALGGITAENSAAARAAGASGIAGIRLFR